MGLVSPFSPTSFFLVLIVLLLTATASCPSNGFRWIEAHPSIVGCGQRRVPARWLHPGGTWWAVQPGVERHSRIQPQAEHQLLCQTWCNPWVTLENRLIRLALVSLPLRRKEEIPAWKCTVCCLHLTSKGGTTLHEQVFKENNFLLFPYGAVASDSL